MNNRDPPHITIVFFSVWVSLLIMLFQTNPPTFIKSQPTVIIGAISAVFIITCLLHEYIHAYFARKYGSTAEYTLTYYGIATVIEPAEFTPEEYSVTVLAPFIIISLFHIPFCIFGPSTLNSIAILLFATHSLGSIIDVYIFETEALSYIN